MTPLLAQTLTLDFGAIGAWVAGNWELLLGAATVAVLDALIENNKSLRENTLVSYLYGQILRPRLGGGRAPKDEG